MLIGNPPGFIKYNGSFAMGLSKNNQSVFQFSPYVSIVLFLLAIVIKHALACSTQLVLFYT